MVVLPLLEVLGKVVKDGQNSATTVEPFMRGPSACVNDTDTEWGNGRFRKMPLSPVGAPGDTALSQAESLPGHNSTLP